MNIVHEYITKSAHEIYNKNHMTCDEALEKFFNDHHCKKDDVITRTMFLSAYKIEINNACA